MADLMSEGKIAALGLSSIDTLTLERAQKVHAITAVQNEYSLIHRHIEIDLFPVLEAQSINLVAFSPLGRGILSGTAVASSVREPLDYRRTDARFVPDKLSSINVSLQNLWAISQQRELPPAVVALAWLFTKSPQILAIPGARTSDQICISLQASTLELSELECKSLDAISINKG
jgi:aryl-alcohol dehydrogenase-like predicted oxidoreductase